HFDCARESRSTAAFHRSPRTPALRCRRASRSSECRGTQRLRKDRLRERTSASRASSPAQTIRRYADGSSHFLVAGCQGAEALSTQRMRTRLHCDEWGVVNGGQRTADSEVSRIAPARI